MKTTRNQGATSNSGEKHTSPATERVRSSSKRELRGRFATFVKEATPEEMRFMTEVLDTWEGNYCPSDGVEVGIACAFASCMDCHADFLLVADENKKKMVVDFLAGRLKELPDSEASVPKRPVKGCSVEERSYCVRLIQLLRDNYWMTELVRQILDREARSKWQWTLKELQQLLDNFGTIEALAGNAQQLGNNWSNHPILRAIRQEYGKDRISAYQSERRIHELVEITRQNSKTPMRIG